MLEVPVSWEALRRAGCWASALPNPRSKQLQVYVAARPFTSFAGDLMQRLSPEQKAVLVDIGLCHYMVVVEDVEGRYTMFDFGPIGGDVHVDCTPLKPSLKSRRRVGAQGEVRTTKLTQLPEACMHVGATDMNLIDIARFNKNQFDRNYVLNVNDCRHYANAIVSMCTGLQNATQRLVQHQFRHRRRDHLRPVDHLLPPMQTLTNPENWHLVRRSFHAVGAAVLLSVTHPLLPPLASASSISGTAVQAKFAAQVQRVVLTLHQLYSQMSHKQTLFSSFLASTLHQKQQGVHRNSQWPCFAEQHGGLLTVAGRSFSAGIDRFCSFSRRFTASAGRAINSAKPFQKNVNFQLATITAAPVAWTAFRSVGPSNSCKSKRCCFGVLNSHPLNVTAPLENKTGVFRFKNQASNMPESHYSFSVTKLPIMSR